MPREARRMGQGERGLLYDILGEKGYVLLLLIDALPIGAGQPVGAELSYPYVPPGTPTAYLWVLLPEPLSSLLEPESVRLSDSRWCTELRTGLAS